MSVSERIEEPIRVGILSEVTPANPPTPTGRRSRRRKLRLWIRDVGLWLSVAWLTVEAVAALCAGVLPLREGRNPSLTLDAPILQPPSVLSAHPLGTDRQGLDILSGIVFGARTSLVVGFGAVLIGVAIGGVLGLIAGYRRGKVDAALNFLNDALLAFPPLILLLALSSVVRPDLKNVTLVLGVLAIPVFFRLTRANAMTYSQRNFVLAARALGARNSRILVRELAPNVAASALSYAFVVVAVLIVAEASLSFLGLSIQRPEPTWGNMIASGQNDLEKHPHLVFAPGIVLFLTVLSLNRIGDWAQRRWDPRSRKL
ncbi:ABC transporter permease [Rhodococcus sp. USK10]|uniref:ABC transporter permease n=1 Tax=Rhodococcus sp. USK10 TaxID=2789739 RepID=UPI001C5D5F46|nr:ABC transporter permease [Rhodococcus sp. USK10]QYB07462.1 ABC transporter permease [Rhodococcus sp. USK10]